MKDLRIHIVLFAVAAVGALLTWTRDRPVGEDEPIMRVWDRDSTDVRLVHYRTEEMDLRIERRTDPDGDFLWGTQIAGTDGPDTLDFPIGPAGRLLVERIAQLRTLRELGSLSPEMTNELGIDGSIQRLLVRFTDEERELVLGDNVLGLPDQYAYEPATGLGYVLPRHVVESLADGEEHIRERWVHHFAPEDVAEVRVDVAGRVRVMSPMEQAGEWTEVGGSTPDLAFATFMQRVNELAIDGFAVRPAPGSVRLLLRVDYVGREGQRLGFLELMRDDSQEVAYFLRSETTRVPAQAMSFLAARVEEGLSGVFSGEGRAGSSAAASSAG